MDGFRKVGLTTCTALVLANMIGTGVFTSLGFQVAALPSPFLIILVWLLGGLVALCGALCYSELAAALPRSGGEYYFLSRIYHPAIGFMAGFISITVGFAAPAALAAMAFGKYLALTIPSVVPLNASIVIVLVLAILHSGSVRASGNLQLGVTLLKVSLIVAFIAIGFWREGPRPALFLPQSGDIGRLATGPFAVALMFVLYSYSGWNAAAYIIGEVRHPQYVVPRALLLATGLVTILYVSINAVFMASASLSDFANHLEVGEIAAVHLLGERGGRIMSGLISIGLISAISAMTWTGPRVAQAVGRDFHMLRIFSRTTSGGIPLLALVLQTLLVLIMLFTASFEAILVYAQISILACSFLAVLGVLILRWRQPNLKRPFRCYGYPWTPLVYLVLNLFAIVYTAWAKPIHAATGLGTLGLGIGLYFSLKNRKITS